MQIELKDLSFSYPDKPPLFDRLDLVLEKGDFVLIEGVSGSGKSTLIRLINRLEEPTGGQVLVDSRPVADAAIAAMRRRIAYLHQTPVAIAGSVAANLEYPFSFKVARDQQKPSKDDQRRWLDDFLLQDVELNDDATQLSVGQQQRLALVRALRTEPEFILCDEPTSALDPHSKEIVEDGLERVNVEQKVGVVLVTHLDFLPKRVHPRRFVLEGGNLSEAPP